MEGNKAFYRINGKIEIDVVSGTVDIMLENDSYCTLLFPNGVKRFLMEEINIRREEVGLIPKRWGLVDGGTMPKGWDLAEGGVINETRD